MESFTGVFSEPPPAPIASFNRLVVDPPVRGVGLGERLDLLRLNAGERMGCGCALLVSHSERRVMHMVKLGFTVVGPGEPLFTSTALLSTSFGCCDLPPPTPASGLRQRSIRIIRHTSNMEIRTMSRSGNAVIWMISGAFLLALMAAMTRFLADDVSWAVIASARSFIAFIFAASSVSIAVPNSSSGNLGRSGSGAWRAAKAYYAAFFAMTHLPLADSVTLFFLQAIWIPCLSWLFLKYAMTFGDMLAVASGISGVVLIVQPQFTSTGVATFVAVLGSVMAAAAMIGLHRVRGVDTWAIVTHFSGVSSVAAICCWLIVPERLPFAEWQLRSFVVLGGIGVCGVLAQFCMSRAYANGNPTWVGVAGLSEVVFAAVLDALIWKRSFSLYAILGMVLITA